MWGDKRERGRESQTFERVTGRRMSATAIAWPTFLLGMKKLQLTSENYDLKFNATVYLREKIVISLLLIFIAAKPEIILSSCHTTQIKLHNQSR
jgi:hypothetical protein